LIRNLVPEKFQAMTFVELLMEINELSSQESAKDSEIAALKVGIM